MKGLPFCHLDIPKADLASFDAETRKQHNPYPNGRPDVVQKDLARRYADLLLLFRKHRDKFSRATF
jgi:endo-1,4-beta-xylanase